VNGVNKVKANTKLWSCCVVLDGLELVTLFFWAEMTSEKLT